MITPSKDPDRNYYKPKENISTSKEAKKHLEKRVDNRSKDLIVHTKEKEKLKGKKGVIDAFGGDFILTREVFGSKTARAGDLDFRELLLSNPNFEVEKCEVNLDEGKVFKYRIVRPSEEALKNIALKNEKIENEEERIDANGFTYIYCSGSRGCYEKSAKFFLEDLVKQGNTVILFDYTGFGENKQLGKPTIRGTEQDFLIVYEDLKKNHALDLQKTVLHGYSLGGGVAAYGSAKTGAKILILDKPPRSIAEAGKDTLTFHGKKIPLVSNLARTLLEDNFDQHIVENIQRSRADVIVHVRDYDEKDSRGIDDSLQHFAIERTKRILRETNVIFPHEFDEELYTNKEKPKILENYVELINMNHFFNKRQINNFDVNKRKEK